MVQATAFLGPLVRPTPPPSAPESPGVGEVHIHTCVHVLDPILRELGLSVSAVHPPPHLERQLALESAL